MKHEKIEDDEAIILKSIQGTGKLPQLSTKDFTTFINHYDLVLVAFGAPWCPWSQRLEPIWLKTHEELKKKDVYELE